MKTNIKKIGVTLLAAGLCVCCLPAHAQTTTTVTTMRGVFTEFVPGSETVVVRTETNAAPTRYVVTRQTSIVDESGGPVAINQIAPGSPLSVQYTGTGDRLVASRIIVQKALATTVPVTTEGRTVTTTTTTRPLTHDEREALEKQREEDKERVEKEIEKRKEALEKAKDALDDDDGH